MAKELPYFKFFCSEWNDGDIALEDYKVQGLFINLCSYYWSNECDLTFKKAEKKFKDAESDLWKTLLDSKIIKEIDNFLVITFLDEQQDERHKTSRKNSESGKASAEKKRLAKLEQLINDNSTSVEIAFNESSTIKRREEKKREEEKKKRFLLFWDLYPKKTNKKDSQSKWMKLKDSEIELISKTIKDFINYKPFEDYTHPNPTTYLNQRRWEDEIPKFKDKEKETMDERIERLSLEAKER